MSDGLVALEEESRLQEKGEGHANLHFKAWTNRYYASVTALRTAANLMPHSIQKCRMLTDQAIPKLLLPENITITSVISMHAGRELKYEEYRVLPCGAADRTILYLHGGAYCLCSSSTHRKLLSEIALRTRAKIYALDYSRPPEHPYPAAVIDVSAMFQFLRSKNPDGCIALAGDSAGGGLVVSSMVAMREAGFPMPKCAVLLSPWVQLDDFKSVSWHRNRNIDYLPKDLAVMFAKAYAGYAQDEDNSDKSDASEALEHSSSRGKGEKGDKSDKGQNESEGEGDGSISEFWELLSWSDTKKGTQKDRILQLDGHYTSSTSMTVAAKVIAPPPPSESEALEVMVAATGTATATATAAAPKATPHTSSGTSAEASIELESESPPTQPNKPALLAKSKSTLVTEALVKEVLVTEALVKEALVTEALEADCDSSSSSVCVPSVAPDSSPAVPAVQDAVRPPRKAPTPFPLNDPGVSPIYADLTGLPSLLVEVGECEVLLDQILLFVSMAQQAGVDVHCDPAPHMVHVYQLFSFAAHCVRCPAPMLSLERIAQFIIRHTQEHTQDHDHGNNGNGPMKTDTSKESMFPAPCSPCADAGTRTTGQEQTASTDIVEATAAAAATAEAALHQHQIKDSYFG